MYPSEEGCIPRVMAGVTAIHSKSTNARVTTRATGASYDPAERLSTHPRSSSRLSGTTMAPRSPLRISSLAQHRLPQERSRSATRHSAGRPLLPWTQMARMPPAPSPPSSMAFWRGTPRHSPRHHMHPHLCFPGLSALAWHHRRLKAGPSPPRRPSPPCPWQAPSAHVDWPADKSRSCAPRQEGGMATPRMRAQCARAPLSRQG